MAINCIRYCRLFIRSLDILKFNWRGLNSRNATRSRLKQKTVKMNNVRNSITRNKVVINPQVLEAIIADYIAIRGYSSQLGADAVKIRKALELIRKESGNEGNWDFL